MIVKIAKAAKSFAGVNYNECKNERGASELLVAANFAINPDNMKKSDMIAYMELVCATNKAVKNKQFHAIISCKGREYSVEQLKDIALLYVDKMGYGKNPYLIYFHSDTDNNHVHIVSTRVGKDGNKINDKMEAVRSQRIMNEIMNVNLGQKAQNDIGKSLEFQFSTIQQYKLLLENQGWKLTEKNGNIQLHRGGEVHATVSIEKVKEKARNYSIDESRKKQIVALLLKYKQGLSHNELKQLMKDKFGIELVFHTGKGHELPYGYTVIDYSKKTVYKGSELMDIKAMLVSPDVRDKINSCNAVLSAILKDDNKKNLTVENVRASLKQYGYDFTNEGHILVHGDKTVLLSVDKKVVEELRYNSRLAEANKFAASSYDEAVLLSKVYNVKVDDIVQGSSVDKDTDKSIYVDMMNSYMSHDSDILSTMKEKGLVFLEYNDKVYLIDKQEKAIVSSDDFSLADFTKEKVNVVPVTGREQEISEKMKSDVDAARGVNVIDIVCDILSQHIHVQQDSPRRKKKRSQQHQ